MALSTVGGKNKTAPSKEKQQRPSNVKASPHKATTDYSIFRNLRGNRDIVPSHVAGLAEVIKNKNLLIYFPLLCNEYMEIIDGQHRLEAAKALGLEVYYVIIPGLKLVDVMSLNTHSKSWTLNDFIRAWIKCGVRDYNTLQEFCTNTGMRVTTAVPLLMPINIHTDGRGSSVVKAGKFRVVTIDYARMIVEQIDDLKQFCDFDLKKDREFINALRAVNRSSNFDMEVLLAKLRTSRQRIELRNTTRYYILELDDLYNYRNRQRVDLYASSQS